MVPGHNGPAAPQSKQPVRDRMAVQEDLFALGLKPAEVILAKIGGIKVPALVVDAHTVKVLTGANSGRKHRRAVLGQARNAQKKLRRDQYAMMAQSIRLTLATSHKTKEGT